MSTLSIETSTALELEAAIIAMSAAEELETLFRSIRDLSTASSSVYGLASLGMRVASDLSNHMDLEREGLKDSLIQH